MVQADDYELWLWPPKTVDVAQALLAASGPVTAKELSADVGTSPSNVSTLLQRPRRYELVMIEKRRREPGARGPRPSIYWLTPDQRNVAERAIEVEEVDRPVSDPRPRVTDRDSGNERSSQSTSSATEAEDAEHVASPGTPDTDIGHLRRGQELVIADVGAARMADLLRALDDATVRLQARWVALYGDELAFVFDGPQPVEPAVDLLAVLDGARIPVRRATVSRVTASERLIEEARSVAPRARRARMVSDALRAEG